MSKVEQLIDTITSNLDGDYDDYNDGFWSGSGSEIVFTDDETNKKYCFIIKYLGEV